MLGIVSTSASPLQPGLVSEANCNQEIISLLLFIPCVNQQPTACTVERAPAPRAVGVGGGGPQGPLVTSQETSSRRQRAVEMKRGRKSPDYRTRALLGVQCTDPWGEAARDYQEPRQHYARFVLFLGLGSGQ